MHALLPTATLKSRNRLRVREPYPVSPAARWILRAALALPFLVIALVTILHPSLLSSSVNADLALRVSEIDWTRGDARWLQQLSPPAGVLLAKLIPGGTAGLSIVGAIGAGWFLQHLIQVMKDKQWRMRNVVLMTIAVGANPVFAYLVVGNLLGFLSLATFGLGTVEMYRFVARRNTDSGFRAGVWFLTCSLIDASGLLLVIVALVAAPFLSVARAGERGARLANILVVFYPSFAAAGSLVLMQLVYLEDPFALYAGAIQYDPANWSIFAGLFTTPGGWSTLLAGLLGATAGLLSSRPQAALMAPLALVVLVLGRVFGLVPIAGVGYVFLATSMIALALTPRLTTPLRRISLTFIALSFAILGWVTGMTRVPVTDWISAFLEGLS